jgi:hypothetical protein
LLEPQPFVREEGELVAGSRPADRHDPAQETRCGVRDPEQEVGAHGDANADEARRVQGGDDCAHVSGVLA